MAKIRVYLDNCAYNRPFDNQEQIKIFLEAEAKKHIQRLIVDQKIHLAYSFINRFETVEIRISPTKTQSILSLAMRSYILIIPMPPALEAGQ